MSANLTQALATGSPQFVHLVFTDILGFAKSLAIPIGRVKEALERGVSFDGSAIKGFVRVQESDMLLYPIPETWQTLPEGGGRLLASVRYPDGKAFPGCPRNCLARAAGEISKLGFQVRVGSELEFFLFNQLTGPPVPNDRGYYFDLDNDAGEAVRRELAALLKTAGISVTASHHENSPGQQEMCLEHDEPLKTADKIMLFRSLAKIAAKNHGLRASFMPKPLYGVNGSGLHLHFSLHHKNERCSREKVMSFIAGILKYGPEVCAITNPLVNSYKRLVPGFEAPVAAVWSYSNRSPMIRIPHQPPEQMRLEVRSPDAACNPYLALAVLLFAGLRGIEEELTPPPPVTSNVFKMERRDLTGLGHPSLPTSLGQALALMEDSQLARDALGEHIFSSYLQAKSIEWDYYRRQVHPWEWEQYLEKY